MAPSLTEQVPATFRDPVLQDGFARDGYVVVDFAPPETVAPRMEHGFFVVPPPPGVTPDGGDGG